MSNQHSITLEDVDLCARNKEIIKALKANAKALRVYAKGCRDDSTGLLSLFAFEMIMMADRYERFAEKLKRKKPMIENKPITPPQKRIIYMVRWNKKKLQWFITSSMEDNSVGCFPTKKGATIDARRLARRCWKKFGRRSQVKIWNKNGRIQIEYTYGKDPVKYKG